MKIKMMFVCMVLAFGMAGASYASWSSEMIIYNTITTGQLVLQNEYYHGETICQVDLDLMDDECIIPFSIKNNSTIPIRKNGVTFYLDGQVIDSLGTIELAEIDDQRIDGELRLRKDSLRDYIMKRDLEEEKNGDLGDLIVEIEFVQANSDRGWGKIVELDIEVVKKLKSQEVHQQELESRWQNKMIAITSDKQMGLRNNIEQNIVENKMIKESGSKKDDHGEKNATLP